MDFGNNDNKNGNDERYRAVVYSNIIQLNLISGANICLGINLLCTYSSRRIENYLERI